MSFFYYDARRKLKWIAWADKVFFPHPILKEIPLLTVYLIEPDDVYEPKTHRQEELDALKIPLDRRDGCKDHYAEFKKCIMVQHQTKGFLKWKRAD